MFHTGILVINYKIQNDRDMTTIISELREEKERRKMIMQQYCSHILYK